MLMCCVAAATLFVMMDVAVFSEPMAWLLTPLTATNESRRYRQSVVLTPAEC